MGYRKLDALTHQDRLAEMRRLHNRSKIYFFIGELHRLTEWTSTDEELAEWFRRVTREKGARAYQKALDRQRRVLNRMFELMDSILQDTAALEVTAHYEPDIVSGSSSPKSLKLHKSRKPSRTLCPARHRRKDR